MSTSKETNFTFEVLPIHPAANLFPEMTQSEFQELVADMRQHGQKVPILTNGGQVIDGRHRLRACNILGIKPELKELDCANDASVEQTVISINLHRRHLSESQRALIAARLANTSRGNNQHTAGAITQKEAANDLGVSVDSVIRAKKVIQDGVPELIKAVESGKLNITSASSISQLSEKKQTELNYDDIKAIQALSKAINKAKFGERRIALLNAIEDKRKNNKPLDNSQGSFDVVLADPPWDYMGELAVGYPCMSTKEICDMPINNVAANDAVLFMWTSASLLSDALEVIKAWGFQFKTSAVWDKGSAGQGAYFRMAHEVLMIATRGKVPEVPYEARPGSVFKYPRTGHSSKPLELYEVIDSMYPELKKIELFCRGEPAQGWSGWGNECINNNKGEK